MYCYGTDGTDTVCCFPLDVNPIHAHQDGKQGGYVYAYGLSSMLDAAGEYAFDSEAQMLRFLPPENHAATSGSFSISRLDSVVIVTGARDVTFTGLEIRHARGAGVRIFNSSNVVFDQCTISQHGMMGLNVTGGSDCGVQNCEVAENGDAGIVMSGGDRISLTPSRHFVRNCTVHHNHRWIYMFSPDVMLAGVGQTLVDSEIFGSPHFAVFYQGNDHLTARCHIHDAAFYSGREWTYRGSRILDSKFSNLTSIFPEAHGLPSAVYLDDQLSSVKISGCVFEQIGGRLMALGGGRHNEFTHNLVIQAAPTQSISMDDRGGSGSKCCAEGKLPYSFLSRVPYNTSKAWARYPDLAKILDDEPCSPRHNIISGNIMW
jgi:hypothetical protein